MLILVVVTVRLSIRGELFGYSRRAVGDTKEAKAFEELETVKMSWEIEKNINEDATIATFLANAKTNGKIDDYRMVEEGEYIIEKDGYERNIKGEKYITFYVYHSSDNTVETIEQRDDKTFNIYSHTKDGYLYGGYYSDYAGKGSYAGDGVEAIDGTEIAYNGTNTAWSTECECKENGKEMHPQDEVTYYLKEVPSDKFLRISWKYTYTGNNVVSFYIFSALDDLRYDDTGVLINEKTIKQQYTRVGSSITMQLSNGTNQTFTPENLFGITGRW